MSAVTHSPRRRLAVIVAILAGLAVVVVLGFGGGHAAASATRARPSVALAKADPVTVSGKGFRAHSRVRVTVWTTGSFVRHPLTNAKGAFSVSFPTVAQNCSAWKITASQGDGTTAMVRARLTMCAGA